MVIDPGHDLRANLATEPIGPGSSTRKIKDGGGTHGVVSGTAEAELNLAVSLRLRALLEGAGIRVVMTRSRTAGTSVGNVARAGIANRAGAALFVRIHADGASSSGARGTHTLYPACATGGRTTSTDRAARQRGSSSSSSSKLSDFPIGGSRSARISRASTGPTSRSILVEVGFMTNPAEDRALATDTYRGRAALGLCRGVLRFLGRSADLLTAFVTGRRQVDR